MWGVVLVGCVLASGFDGGTFVHHILTPVCQDLRSHSMIARLIALPALTLCDPITPISISRSLTACAISAWSTYVDLNRIHQESKMHASHCSAHPSDVR